METLMAQPPRRQRTWSRTVHLLAAALLGTYVYAPPAVAQPIHLLLAVVVIPAATLSGLFLWKQAQIRRLFTAQRPYTR
jgi:hypothetical protein